jgi:hypothetical protein
MNFKSLILGLAYKTIRTTLRRQAGQAHCLAQRPLLRLFAGVVNLTVCAAVGAAAGYLTSANWLAASLWVFAGLRINGTIAIIEDGRPCGFDNPDGQAPPFGWLAVLGLALGDFTISAAAIATGCFIQFG